MAVGRWRRLQLREPEGGLSFLLRRTMHMRGLAGLSNLGCYSPGPRETQRWETHGAGLCSGSSAFHPGHPHTEMQHPCPLCSSTSSWQRSPPLSVALFPSHSVSWLYSSLASYHTNLFVFSAHSSNDIFFCALCTVSSKLPARAFPPPPLFSH